MWEMGGDIYFVVIIMWLLLFEKLFMENVIVGDLGDLEEVVVGLDLLIINFCGKIIFEKLNIDFYWMGMLIYDCFGNG